MAFLHLAFFLHTFSFTKYVIIMYKILSLLVAFFAVCSVAQAQKLDFARHSHTSRAAAPLDPSRIAAHDDFPELALYFEKDLQLNQWDSTYRWTYSYFPNGDIAEQIGESYGGPGTGFVNNQRVANTFASPGNVASTAYSGWNGSAWSNQYQFTYAYDSQNQIIADWFYQWNGNQWDTVNGSRYTLGYVFSNRIASRVGESWNFSTSAWDLDYREDYNWPSAQGWDSVIYSSWNGGNWQNEERYIDVAWHDIDEDEPTAGLYQGYTGSLWENRERFSNQYGTNDGYIYIEENWNGTSWDSSYKEVVEIDSHGHDVGYLGYFYAGGWHLSGGNENTFTYDAQGRTLEEIDEYLDSLLFVVSVYKTVYPSFFTNAPEPTSLIANVTAYPNPCIDKLNFQVELKQTSTVYIALYDLQGRLRMQTVTPARVGEDIALPISETLENSTYIYRLGTKEGEATGKVTVQR